MSAKKKMKKMAVKYAFATHRKPSGVYETKGEGKTFHSTDRLESMKKAIEFGHKKKKK